MPRLELGLVRRAPAGELAVRVTLHSEAKPAISSRGYADPDAEDLPYVVAVVAGSLAEHQCKTCGDRHNPDQIAKAAVGMLDRLKAKGLRANSQVEAEA